MHAFLVALVLSQTIYVWTDAKGVEHFTDDQSTIPKGVKVRTTAGTELNVVEADKPAPKNDAKTAVTIPASPKAPTNCETARAQVTELEKQRADQTVAQAQLRDVEAKQCQQVLATRGQGDYARCTAGIEARVQNVAAMKTRDLSNQLDAARETLRKAQLDGCR
ncbi:MAG: DUF4124 domain-containing protein [Archangium sp.]